LLLFFFFSSRRRHTRWPRDWSSDVCSSDLTVFSDRTRERLRETRDDSGHQRRNENETNGSQPACPKRGGGFFDIQFHPFQNRLRSEERRVGKECRYGGWRCHEKKKEVQH